MTTDLIFRVSVALLTGATLLASTASVGPYRRATDGAGLRFACLNLRGSLITAREEWDEIASQVKADRIGWSASRVPIARHDWSAFAAARAFVAVVGASEAELAIKRLGDES